VVAVAENIGLDHAWFGHYAFDRIAAAIDHGRYRLDNVRAAGRQPALPAPGETYRRNWWNAWPPKNILMM
jgi:hypothetical protein